MSLTYPLTLPAAFRVARMTITGRSVVAVAESPFTMEQQVYQHQGQGWQLDVSLPPMTRADAEDVIGFLLSLQGRYGTFYGYDSANRTPRGSISGSATCSGAQTARSSSLSITGHSGTLSVGDWIQISTYLYKVAQVNSSSSVDVFPRLRAAHANGTAVTYTNPKGIFRLASNSTRWDIDAAKVYGIAFSAVEAQ